MAKLCFQFMLNHEEDFELHWLLNETSVMSSKKFPYRGFCMLNSKSSTLHHKVCFYYNP